MDTSFLFFKTVGTLGRFHTFGILVVFIQVGFFAAIEALFFTFTDRFMMAKAEAVCALERIWNIWPGGDSLIPDIEMCGWFCGRKSDNKQSGVDGNSV